MQPPALNLTIESDLEQLHLQVLIPFMQTMPNGMLEVSPGVNLHYRYILPDDVSSMIVLLPGRAESAIKYAELCYQLYVAGFAIFIFDHRGQGLSSRPENNPQIGHVEHFKQYVDDAQLLINQVAKRLVDDSVALNLLAHSMGGSIGSCLLIRQPELFQNAVLCSPMLGINSFVPEVVAIAAAKLGLFCESCLHKRPSYFIGQGDYRPVDFTRNKLTSSPIRYKLMMQLLEQEPALVLGGVSNQWLIQAIDMMKHVRQHAGKIQTPTKVLMALDDRIVDNRAIKQVTEKFVHADLVQFPGANHEILFESDTIRTKALESIIEHFCAG